MLILVMLVGLLFATVVMVGIGDRFDLPWPVLLALLAAGGALLPSTPEFAVPEDLILPIFLPPLLWALARKSSWGVIRSQLNVIVSLSVALVMLTIAALAGTAYLLLPGIGVASAVVLASALAPPDPVAVDAVAKPVGLPQRITTTLQTEGLFNDAASIVTFNLALAALLGGSHISWVKGVVGFLWSLTAAVILGLVFGRLAAFFTEHVDGVAAQTSLTWVLPFATYIIAEKIHASGVIAIVITAIELNSRASMGPQDRLSGGSFWSTVELLFTGVAFGLMGLSAGHAIDAVGTELWHAVWVGIVLSAVAITVRFIWLYLMYRTNLRKTRAMSGPIAMRAPLRLQEVLIMTWSGMRGLVTLALVLSIPSGVFPFENELAVVALTVLTCTMVIPALALPWIVSKLSLSRGPDADGDKERYELVVRARRAAAKTLAKQGEISEEQADAIKLWIGDHLTLEGVPEPSWDHRKSLEKRARIRTARIMALQSAQMELLAARSEAGVNPAYVDEILSEVDRMLMAALRL